MSKKFIPNNIQEFAKNSVNWKKFIKVVQKLAFGNFHYINGNGIDTIAQPNEEMLKLLLYISYGRPNSMPEDNSEKDKMLAAFQESIKGKSVLDIHSDMNKEKELPDELDL